MKLSEAFQEFVSFHPYPVEFHSFCTYKETLPPPEQPTFYFENGFSAKLVHETLMNGHLEKTGDVSVASIIIGNNSNEVDPIYDNLQPLQRVTHYKFTRSIGLKVGLHRLLYMFEKQFHVPLDFYPESYILPYQMNEFKAAFDKSLWIEKPTRSSCGRGIKIHNKFPVELGSREVIMQKYIRNPLLINGYKFDLRFYVCVTSLDPLRIYINNDGLVRLATEKYCEHFEDISDLSAHLTNFSVNKQNKDFIQTDDVANDGKGSKWSHEPFWPFLKSIGFEIEEIKKKIEDAIVTIFIAGRSELIKQKTHRNSFELFGVDILICENGDIYVLEINISPAMGRSSELDRHIKSPVCRDFFNLSLTPVASPAAEKIETIFNNEDNQNLSAFISICEMEISLGRCGGFRQIFPTLERLQDLGKYLKPTSNDKALAQWLQADNQRKKNYLNQEGEALESFLDGFLKYTKHCLY